jgi:hypothetical protein
MPKGLVSRPSTGSRHSPPAAFTGAGRLAAAVAAETAEAAPAPAARALVRALENCWEARAALLDVAVPDVALLDVAVPDVVVPDVAPEAAAPLARPPVVAVGSAPLVVAPYAEVAAVAVPLAAACRLLTDVEAAPDARDPICDWIAEIRAKTSLMPPDGPTPETLPST